MPALKLQHTKVDTSEFEMDIEGLKVSGGTASFYRLRLQPRAAAERGSVDYFVGKDLRHAKDEVDFYEEAKALLTQDIAGPLSPLLGFMFEYAGVLSVRDPIMPSAQPIDLLVLRNLRDGCRNLRMLDMKIGQQTASAGWKGKAVHRTLVQNAFDCYTNSVEEGFRLEGFDGAPPALASMESLCVQKRHRFRVVLQRMRCADVLMHFLDVHQRPEDPRDDELAQVKAPIEVAEVVLRNAVRQFVMLALACRAVPAPQKWVGSSVALCFDAGLPETSRLPSRFATDEDIRKDAKIQVNIFDWGRSELNTPQKHAFLSNKQKADYETFWLLYVDGIDRLAWEVARAYKHRFGNPSGWSEALVSLVEFDAYGYDQVLGYVRIAPLQPSPVTTVQIRDSEGILLKNGKGEVATLTYSIEKRSYPKGSRIRYSWRVCLIRASNLPYISLKGAPDAFVELIAISGRAGSPFGFRQVTSVQPGTVSPEWRETLDLPVAARAGVLESVMADVSPTLHQNTLILPREEAVAQLEHATQQLLGEEVEDHDQKEQRRSVIYLSGEDLDVETSIQEWTYRLNQAASTEDQSANWMHAFSARPRVYQAEALHLIQQPSLPLRIIALAGVIVSVLLAILVVIDAAFQWHQPVPWTRRDSPQRLYILFTSALFQIIVAPMVALFEAGPRGSKLIGCDRLMDLLTEYCSLNRLNRRGFLYLLQGCVWILRSFITTSQSSFWVHFLFVLGGSLSVVGVMFFCAHCGALRRHVVRKIRRGKTGRRKKRPLKFTKTPVNWAEDDDPESNGAPAASARSSRISGTASTTARSSRVSRASRASRDNEGKKGSLLQHDHDGQMAATSTIEMKEF